MFVITSAIKRYANSIARKHGCGVATQIVVGDRDDVVERVEPGYRKITTGQYVPNKYLNNFGWKNTYYEKAVTVVMIDKNILNAL